MYYYKLLCNVLRKCSKEDVERNTFQKVTINVTKSKAGLYYKSRLGKRNQIS